MVYVKSQLTLIGNWKGYDIMLQKKESSIILLLVVSWFSAAWAGAEIPTVRARGKTVSRQSSVAPKQADPYEDTLVLVKLLWYGYQLKHWPKSASALSVSPIGQASGGVSILNILACLDDPEKAEVISGIKLLAYNGNNASLSDKKTVYVKREHGKSVSYEAYDSGKTFNVVVSLKSAKAILVKYSYSESSFEEYEGEQEAPPRTFTYDWQGVVTMSTGKPIIAGASQNDDSIIFLIMIATIQVN